MFTLCTPQVQLLSFNKITLVLYDIFEFLNIHIWYIEIKMFFKSSVRFCHYVLGKFLVTLSCIMFILLHPLGQEIAYMKDTHS